MNISKEGWIKIAILAAVLTLISLFLLGCVTNPTTGKSEIDMTGQKTKQVADTIAPLLPYPFDVLAGAVGTLAVTAGAGYARVKKAKGDHLTTIAAVNDAFGDMIEDVSKPEIKRVFKNVQSDGAKKLVGQFKTHESFKKAYNKLIDKAGA